MKDRSEAGQSQETSIVAEARSGREAYQQEPSMPDEAAVDEHRARPTDFFKQLQSHTTGSSFDRLQ